MEARAQYVCQHCMPSPAPLRPSIYPRVMLWTGRVLFCLESDTPLLRVRDTGHPRSETS